MTTLPETTDVLVVGAGPTGLTLAILLRRQGIDCLVVDQLDEPLTGSRALCLHARSQEILQALEVLGPVSERSCPLECIRVNNARGRLADLDLTQLDAPFPRVLSCPQAELEACLTDRLHALGGRIIRSAELADFRQHAEGVQARLYHQAREQALACRMLVGCDGARSRVRDQLGLRFDGARRPDHFLLADLPIDWDRDRRSAHGFLLAEGVLLALPLPEGWRLILQVPEEESASVSEPGLLPLIQRLQSAGEDPRLGEPWWLRRFSVQRRLVSHYRRNRVLLAGDACHVQSPLGDQGLNTGLADAFNLGWKLALYLQGQANGSLLDTYERERRPVAQSLVQGADVLARHSLAQSRLLRPLRDRGFDLMARRPRLQRRLVRRVSRLDVAYPALASAWPSSAPGLRRQTPQPGERVPDAMLVHPDGSHSQRLHGLLRDPRHHLLIWVPEADNHRARVSTYALADRIRMDYGERMAVTVITPAPLEPALAELRDLSTAVLVDRTGEFTHRFGTLNSLWVMRPDGHLAWRGPLRDGDWLVERLAWLFRPGYV